MSDHSENRVLRFAAAFVVLVVAGLTLQAVCDHKRAAFEAKKAAIMAKDIPPLEKCMQLLQLLEPK